jgi:hypothetical protein
MSDSGSDRDSSPPLDPTQYARPQVSGKEPRPSYVPTNPQPYGQQPLGDAPNYAEDSDSASNSDGDDQGGNYGRNGGRGEGPHDVESEDDDEDSEQEAARQKKRRASNGKGKGRARVGSEAEADPELYGLRRSVSRLLFATDGRGSEGKGGKSGRQEARRWHIRRREVHTCVPEGRPPAARSHEGRKDGIAPSSSPPLSLRHTR